MLKNEQQGGVRPSAGLRPALPDDLGAILTLLEAAGLPSMGVSESLDGFLVAIRGGDVVGAAGLETHGTHALLRSVVVAPVERGRGTALALVHRLMDSARKRKLERLWLLTETAESFFGGLGFTATDRAEAPEEIRRSHEFTDCCPASATLMSRRVQPYRVLVLCTANSARSQIGEALLEHVGGGLIAAASAGTAPAPAPHPMAVQVLDEIGIDWSARRSKSIEEAGTDFDLVITVCDAAQETCPVLPGARMMHWGFPDPAAEADPSSRLEAFRRVRDELAGKVADLVRQLRAG